MPSSDLARLATTALTSNPQTVTLVLELLREQLGNRRDPDSRDELVTTWRRYRELLDARNAFAHGSTTSSQLVPAHRVSETTIDSLVQTQDAYVARQKANEHHENAVVHHQSKYLEEWQVRVKKHTERSHEEMLLSLWESGLSWRDIARLLKVSIAAVQKWRAGEKMSPKNFARLRDFMAAYDTVAAHKPDVDIASWLDVPLISEVPVTLRTLWTEGDPETFFEYALGDLKPEAALDSFDPEWRQRYRNDGFETFTAVDGQLSIRTRSR